MQNEKVCWFSYNTNHLVHFPRMATVNHHLYGQIEYNIPKNRLC